MIYLVENERKIAKTMKDSDWEVEFLGPDTPWELYASEAKHPDY